MAASELIKKIRVKTGLSQEDFAREIHVSFTTVNRWENNKSTPNRMARVLIVDYCEKHGINRDIIDAIKDKRR